MANEDPRTPRDHPGISASPAKRRLSVPTIVLLSIVGVAVAIGLIFVSLELTRLMMGFG